jgi:hypothetical protein
MKTRRRKGARGRERARRKGRGAKRTAAATANSAVE